MNDTQKQQTGTYNGQFPDDTELSILQETKSNFGLFNKYSLMRLNQRPQYSILSPYIQHLQKPQRQTTLNQIKPKQQNSHTANQTNFEDDQYNNGDNKVKKDALKFKTNMIQAQIQKQKFARKAYQYQEEEYTTNNIDNYNTSSKLILIDLPTKKNEHLIYSAKQNNKFNERKASNDQPKYQTRYVSQKDPCKMKTLDAKPRPDSNGSYMADLMKQETMNIIRQRTNYGNFGQPKERANSVAQKYESISADKVQKPQIIQESKIENLKLNEQCKLITKSQPNTYTNRNHQIRDSVSKSTQMQSMKKLLQNCNNIVEKENQKNTLNKTEIENRTLIHMDTIDMNNDESFTEESNDNHSGAVPLAINNRMKYLNFRPFKDNMNETPNYNLIDKGYYFKFYNPQTDIKLIRYTLEDNGFIEFEPSMASTNNKSFSQQTSYNQSLIKVKRDIWTVMWSCQIMKSNVFQSMSKYQKVNHFPRSFELTRKDFMNERIARMIALHGKRNFNFTPATFVLPKEMEQLQREMEANRNRWWIIKPSASAQGKGIYITNDYRDIQGKQSLVASHYIDNPMLINGLKFDMRIYVAITSINPLRIYMYEEGLTRFATCQYHSTSLSDTKTNRFMHLTNYSINKLNKNAFVQNNDPKNQQYGSKWSLKGLRQQLRKMGIDDTYIFKRIEDIVIKTIISAEPILNNAFEMFVPHRNNCFELLGFDILVDENLSPWLLEVNLSPSLACDSNLDQLIKANLISDLLNLAGIVNIDQRKDNDIMISTKHGFSKGSLEYQPKLKKKKQKNQDSLITKPAFDISFSGQNSTTNQNTLIRNNLKGKERVIVREAEEEYNRRGRFQLIFPCDNYNYYKSFFEEDRPLNALLDKQFRELHITGQFKNK